jgi:DNA gyrase inhibitor GyrI
MNKTISIKQNKNRNGVIFMAITGGEYGKMAKKASPPTNKVKNGIFAFHRVR